MRSRPLDRLVIQIRYLRVLLRRFKITFFSLFALLLGCSVLLHFFYAPGGKPLTFPQALGVTYFLMMGQPSAELPESLPLEILFMAIPPLSILAVADGLVRFAFLFFAMQRSDKEWFAVMAETYKDHVIVCGAGRVGYRVTEQLRKLEVPVVVIDQKEDAPFVGTIRALGIPMLVDDVRSHQALEKANVRKARAVVCATNDDVVNLNTAIDGRRLNPEIRVVMRLFDDDLVVKMKQALGMEAFSTSALAAPAFAIAALDPCIRTSFDVGGKLMVVWEVTVAKALHGITVASLRDDRQVFVLDILRPGGEELLEPKGAVALKTGDKVTLQAPLSAYQEIKRIST